MVPSELAERAKGLLAIMQGQARRPYVVELTGTPKSGKTTSLATLQGFFKSCGYRVQVLRERAAECPLPMKGHFFFNAWTTTTMLAEVVAAVETGVDLILVDRAFFDALIWLELQQRKGQVSEEERDTFASFVVLERWRSLVDVTILMTATPTVALQRENQNAILPRTGSLMNSDFLDEFNEVLSLVQQKYRAHFPVMTIDSSIDGVVRVNAKLAEEILDRLEDWADPPVATVERSTVQAIFGSSALLSGPQAVESWKVLERSAKPMKRSVAESDQGVVQLVSSGVCISDDAALVLQRSTEDQKFNAYGPYTLWKGCHIEMRHDSKPTLEVAMRCLETRLESDLHLKKIAIPEHLALAWGPATAAESQHLGCLFALKVADPQVIKSLRRKEFRRGARGHKLVGRLLSSEELRKAVGEFEPWSKELIEQRLVP